MLNDAELQQWTRHIVEAFHPERIVLFGSYAHGQPREESDVDLLVIMPFEGHPVKLAAQIRKALGKLMTSIRTVDILVRTPQEIEAKLGYGDTFFSTILQQGRVLYEDHSRS